MERERVYFADRSKGKTSASLRFNGDRWTVTGRRCHKGDEEHTENDVGAGGVV